MSAIRWIDPRDGAEVELVPGIGCSGCRYDIVAGTCPHNEPGAPYCASLVWRSAAESGNSSLNDLERDLLAALGQMVDAYCSLANSGDAGFWDPEALPEVQQARAAIAKAEGRS